MVGGGGQVGGAGPRGKGVTPIEKFCHGLFTPHLQPDEILIEIRIPTPPARSGGAYVKLERKVGDYATAGSAVQLTLDASGALSRVGIGLTNLASTPIKAQAAEKSLAGKKPDPAAIPPAGPPAGARTPPTARP